MIIIVSSLTGRTLLTMDVVEGVVMLPPEAACVALVSLQESGFVSDDTVTRDSQPNSARIPSGHLLGIGLFRSNQATVAADYSGPTERKEE